MVTNCQGPKDFTATSAFCDTRNRNKSDETGMTLAEPTVLSALKRGDHLLVCNQYLIESVYTAGGSGAAKIVGNTPAPRVGLDRLTIGGATRYKVTRYDAASAMNRRQVHHFSPCTALEAPKTLQRQNMYTQLDFSRFHGPDAKDRDEFCRALVSDLKQYGFARLVNHDVPPCDIQKAFETSRRFFKLPVDEKLKSPHPPTTHPHRGYSAFGVENVSVVSNHSSSKAMPFLKDMKESYDIGSEHDQLYSNIWPPAGVYDAFQPTFTSFFEVCYRAQLAILEAISIGLGLPAQKLGELHVDQSNELRLTHYPAVARDEFGHSTRIAAHTDFGTITLLFQDSVGGCVKAETPPGSGTFVDVASGGQHECIVNVGDCLAKWTGLNSVCHRVHLPEKDGDSSGQQDIVDERFSIAYFGKPDRSASLRPLLGEAKVSSYMTAGEFQNMRIQGTY
ncbi:isopenicillin N synthase [Apiospora hydei]|uniref:Isopenicillin N synthase n=1 Tax=Apiospora hydei TaxID=1337664 RepID=A0ABR1WQU9_9PEZI